MESATHPRVIAGRLAPTWITRVCVNSTEPLQKIPERQDGILSHEGLSSRLG